MKELIRRIPGARRLARALGISPANYREFLLRMLPPGGIGMEIGVHLGEFSAQILEIARPRELHLVDPWKFEPDETYKDSLYGSRIERGQAELDERCHAVCKRFESEVRCGQVKIHRGYSHDVLALFPANSFDWVYIDGNHLYEFAKQDLERSFEKTKPGGFITGDDYAEGGWFQGGVKRAVDEFVRTRPVKFVTTRYRQFVLRKDS